MGKYLSLLAAHLRTLRPLMKATNDARPRRTVSSHSANDEVDSAIATRLASAPHSPPARSPAPMNKKLWAAGVTFVLGILCSGCPSGGVGDPCTPEDEYQQYFSGYSIAEVNIESRSFQCETRLCLVNHFQGRVTCPYGQELDEKTGELVGGPSSEDRYCHIPGTSAPDQRIKVTVKKQLTRRRPN